VAYISQSCIVSLVVDIVNDCWHIIETHLLLIEVPKLFLLGSEVNVIQTEVIPTIITKPNIVTSLGELEGRCFTRLIDDPLKTRVLNTMHHKHGWAFSLLLV